MNGSKPRARYTLEFELTALRLFTDGQVASVTGKILSFQKQTLESWVRFENKCQPMSLATS